MLGDINCLIVCFVGKCYFVIFIVRLLDFFKDWDCFKDNLVFCIIEYLSSEVNCMCFMIIKYYIVMCYIV